MYNVVTFFNYERQKMKLTQVKSFAVFAVFNGLFAYSVYAGAIQGVKGWGNIAIFITCIMFLVGLILFLSREDHKALREYVQTQSGKFEMPPLLDAVVDFTLVGVLLFHGWFVTATLLFFSWAFMASFKSAVKSYVFNVLKS